MDKYKKTVLKLLRIYGEEVLQNYQSYLKNKKEMFHFDYAIDHLKNALREYKMYKHYKVIQESIKGYHTEWL